MEDGVCTNSLALLTAAKFGLPESILQRAEEFSGHWNAGVGHSDQGPTSITKVSSRGVDHNIQHAVTILEEVVGNGSSSIQIPPSYMSPPSLEGTSCVYILLIGAGEEQGGTSSKMRCYIGETDSLSQRLAQHRSKGKDWSSLHAIAIKIEDGKSSARNVESLVIRRMAKRGFNLISITDGKTVRSPGRTG
mmetsp:Transcript_44669/g.93744  ORF Transcript_44669/g.93744 Transcript_44669/m.93744 type:complete len:191 (+) Transcript_44669:1-573(+)